MTISKRYGHVNFPGLSPVAIIFLWLGHQTILVCSLLFIALDAIAVTHSLSLRTAAVIRA
jgi:hypothetical protein